MSPIAQCPLSFHGLSSLLRRTTETHSAASPSTSTTKTALQRDALEAGEARLISGADQLHPRRAMFEICLTCRDTPLSARLSFRVYFSCITRQTAAAGQLCARRHVPNYRIPIAVEQAAAAGFNPSIKGRRKKESNKIVGADRLLWAESIRIRGFPRDRWLLKRRCSFSTTIPGTAPKRARHRRAVMQAAKPVLPQHTLNVAK